MLSLLAPRTLALLATLVHAGSAGSGEWPGWRGPGGSGVAPGSPPLAWSETENVRWKALIPGRGSSSPVVWGTRVFLTTAVATGKEAPAPAAGPEGPDRDGRGRGEEGGEGRGAREGGADGAGAPPGGAQERGRGRRDAPLQEQDFLVLALNRADGSLAWERTATTAMPHQGTHPDGNYASPTLVTDGEHVFASFGSFGVFAYTAAGEPLWQKDLGDMEIMGGFGEGSSPVLFGDVLLINWDHEGDSFLVALDKRTGAERWRQARPSGTTWTTPVVVQVGETAEVIVGAARTIAYDLADGHELWSYGAVGGRGGGVITSPVVSDGLLVLATGNRDGEFRAIELAAAKGEVKPGAGLLWTHAGDTPHIPSPLVFDGIVYALKANSGLLSAFDVGTGERLYGPTRMAGLANAYASPVAAGGRLYFVDREGATEILAAGPEFQSLAVNTLDEAFDASPAVAGDELYLRGREHLYCIAEG